MSDLQEFSRSFTQIARLALLKRLHEVVSGKEPDFSLCHLYLWRFSLISEGGFCIQESARVRVHAGINYAIYSCTDPK